MKKLLTKTSLVMGLYPADEEEYNMFAILPEYQGSRTCFEEAYKKLYGADSLVVFPAYTAPDAGIDDANYPLAGVGKLPRGLTRIIAIPDVDITINGGEMTEIKPNNVMSTEDNMSSGSK